MASVLLLYVFAICFTGCLGYVDFDELTKPMATPQATIKVPRPHQLPDDNLMQHAVFYSMITAIAPSITMASNGSLSTSWSTHYNTGEERTKHKRGVSRRQGVFSSDVSSLFATCTPCTSVTNVGTSSGECHPLTYSGVFQGGYVPTVATGSVCYASSYNGALNSVPTSTTPCCPSCTPPSNTSMLITTGVLSTSQAMTTSSTPAFTSSSSSSEVDTTVTATTATTITISETTITSSTVISGTSTVTVITSTTIIRGPSSSTASRTTSTTTQVTLTTTLVTPTSPQTPQTPFITALPAQVSGCGTASGSGTVVGSGTVYIGPYGLIPVTSSGTASGFASTVIGCGNMIATTGVFTGTATIIGCGEGTGCAALTGSGTVYPAILGGLVPIVSSGTVSGCGRVVGCGTLAGTGTFTISSLYTSTITPKPIPTVEVYISYCPSDSPYKVVANSSDVSSQNENADSDQARYFDKFSNNTAPSQYDWKSNHTLTNSTSNSTLTNPLCQLCHNDSGICCPLFSICGMDGHCPYDALVNSGYILHGYNVVDRQNSSERMGMPPSRNVAPGLPGNKSSVLGVGASIGKRSLLRYGRHGHGHANRLYG